MLNQHLSRSSQLVTLFVGWILSITAYSTLAQKVDLPQLKQLNYRHIGPVGNRISTITGVAGNPLVYFAGAASGGIWKTIDGGMTWKPVFDDKPVHSIGSITVAPSDPQVVWVGTGEPHIRSNVSVGDGIWKSVDGGTSWQHMGLSLTGRISRVIVNPSNPDIVYAAVQGHGYSPQKERGVYRTQDGGRTWTQVLFVNDSTGASDLVMDPTNPRILFAGMWQLDIKTWGRQSGGKGSGIFMSRDGGTTWKRLVGNGLPKLAVGKIALAMSKADPLKVYALIETADGVPPPGVKEAEAGELWRSDDGGTNWNLTSYDQTLGSRGAYYTRCQVSPDNADELVVLAEAYNVSKDGGRTFQKSSGISVPNWDHHELWVDPTDGNRQAVAGDGGVSISNNRGKTWFRVQLPVAQLYHVTTDTRIPYNVYANRQDGPSSRLPSRYFGTDFHFSGIPRGEWLDIGGGESGFATPDPVDPSIVWSSASGSGAGGGIVVRFNEKNRQFRQVEVWPEATFGSPAKDVKYRFQWTFPLLISPHDRNTVYVTSQNVHKTTNGGQSWQVISPDLTLNDKRKQGVSGGLTPDNIGVEYGCVIYAFDESPIQKGVLWAGSNDGLVHVSVDGGSSWQNVTGNIKNLPSLGTVRNIDASKWKAGKAYLTVDFHQLGNFESYVYKTEDFGKTWIKITEGIPQTTLSYACNIREDPTRPGLLYLGTENALYISFNDGVHWQSLMTNLPAAPMYWLAIQENFNDLVVGTYGRGIWILDDITPLQQMTSEVTTAAAHLFAPRAAYRFRPITSPYSMFDDPSAGENPPVGAPLNYWLSAEANDSLTISISDANKVVIRKLHHKGKAGLNRLWWDLREDPSTTIIARNKPINAYWVNLGDKRAMPAPAVPHGLSPLVKPGTYTVTLTVGNKTYSQPIKVLKDPNTDGSEADITTQYEFVSSVKKDLNSIADQVNQLEWTRRQLADMKEMIADKRDVDEAKKDIDSLAARLTAVEETFMQLKMPSGIRWNAQTTEKMLYLASAVETADFPPAQQHLDVYQVLKKRFLESQAKVQQLMQTELPAFIERMKKYNLNSPIIKPN